MNKKKKSVLMVILLSLVVLSLSACSKKDDMIDIDDGSNAEKAPVANVAKLDLNKKPDTGVKLEPVELKEDATYLKSSYASNLNNNLKLIYDEIFQSIEKTNDKYVPTTNLRVSEMVRIMNIMIIDEPILFHLKDSYSYKTNDKGFVSEINFKYNMNAEEYVEAKSLLLSTLSIRGSSTDVALLESTYDNLATKDIIPLSEAYDKNLERIESIQSSTLEGDKYDKFNFEDIGKTVLSHGINSISTEMSTAKLINLTARYRGIPSMIIVGERLDKNIKGINKFEKDLDKVVEISSTDVKVNQDKLNMWNLVSLDNHWFHIDTLYYNSFKGKLNEQNGKSINENVVSSLLGSLRYGFALSDEQISLTKLFYVNEDILGIAGMAYSNDFYGLNNPMYGSHIRKVQTNAIEKRVKDSIVEFYTGNISNVGYFVLTFEDIGNYNYVDITIDKIMVDLIHNGFLPIDSYRVESDVDNMMIIVHNIIEK